MIQKSTFLVISLVLLAATGCPSLSTMQTPSTVPKGEARIGIGLEGLGFSDGTTTVTVPQMEVNARYGITDEIDIGGKLYFLGAEVGGKYQFLKGDFEAAVAPAIAYISVSSDATDSMGNTSTAKASVAYIHLPILFGYKLSQSLEVSFGPKFLYTIASSSASASSGSEESKSSATASGLMAGGYFSIPIRVGHAFWVAPEVNVYKPFADGTSGLIWQGGLMLLFGGGGPTQSAVAAAGNM